MLSNPTSRLWGLRGTKQEYISRRQASRVERSFFQASTSVPSSFAVCRKRAHQQHARTTATRKGRRRAGGGRGHQDPVIEMLPRNVRRTSSIVSKSVVSIRTICLPVARSICSICCQVALLCTKLTEIPFRPKRPVRPAKTRRDRETRL